MSNAVNSANFERHDYQPAWRSFYKHIIAMVILFVVAIVLSFMGWFSGKAVAILWLVVLLACVGCVFDMWARRLGMVLSVRHDEVAFDTGLFTRKSTEISYQNLRTIEVEQTVAQRLLNLGTICIASSGTGGYEIKAVNIIDPYAVRNEIQERERAVKGTGSAGASDSEGEKQNA